MADAMSSEDSLLLERLTVLEANYAADPMDVPNAVEYAHTLHWLRRDKPALRVMMSLPSDSMDPSDRLFTASMMVFDSDVQGALSTAAPVCLPAVVLLAAGSSSLLILTFSSRRRGSDG